MALRREASKKAVEKGKARERGDKVQSAVRSDAVGEKLVAFKGVHEFAAQVTLSEDAGSDGEDESTLVGEGKFNFCYHFKGDGKHICKLPSVEDMVEKSGYTDISFSMLRVMTNINFMALRYNNILVECNGLVNERRAFIEEKVELEKEIGELKNRSKEASRIAEEKAKWAEEKAKLMDENRVLKEKFDS